MVLLIFFTWLATADEIIFVVEVARHGAREPSQVHNWYQPERHSSLTPQGVLQHCALGHELARRYTSIIPQLYDPSTIYVRSTDVDRTIKSALAQLSCMFPENDSFSIFTENQHLDTMLRTWKSCASIQHNLEHVKVQFKEEDSLPAYMQEEISEIEGVEDPYFHFHHVSDAISCLTFAGKRDIIPYSDKFIHDSRRALNKYIQLRYDSDKMFTKLFVSDFFVELSTKFHAVLADQDPTKFALYSAHDYTLAGILSVLDVWDGIQPPFASSIIFELRRTGTGLVRVNMLYNDKPILLAECGYKMCSYSEFMNILEINRLTEIAKYTCDDVDLEFFENQISLYTITNTLLKAVALILVAVFLIKLVLLCFVAIRRKQKANEEQTGPKSKKQKREEMNQSHEVMLEEDQKSIHGLQAKRYLVPDQEA